MLILVESAEKPGEGFLGQIFRETGIPDMQAAVPQNLWIILPNKDLDGLLIAIVHPVQKQKITVHAFPPLLYNKSAFT